MVFKIGKVIRCQSKTSVFGKVCNISINIDSGFYGGRSEYLNIALKFHSKYSKLKNSEISINQDQTLKLKKEIKDELVCKKLNRTGTTMFLGWYSR